MAFQNFYSSKITNAIGAADVAITVDNAPTSTSGRMTLEARNATQREIIKYTGVAGNVLTGVTRGQGGTTAKTHVAASLIQQNATAEDLQDLYDAFNSFAATNLNGWATGANLPTTIAYNGNRNYLFTFNGIDLTAIYGTGMKVRGTRTTAAPTRGALFNGTTQYLNKTTPNKLTFTDNFTLLATGKMTAYQAGDGYLGGRSDATGNTTYGLAITPSGQIELYGAVSAGNNRRIYSRIKVPLNREFKIRATWAAGVVTMYLDGQLLTTDTVVTGTCTTITQAGDLAVGRLGSQGSPFAGEVSQFAIFDAVLSQATIRSLDSQGLIGNETNLKTAFSLDNTLLDLNTTTPNDLTNNNTVTFQTGGGFGDYGISASLCYGVVVTKPVFSGGNTTFQVQAPAGSTFPTSATPLTAISYSPHQSPVGYPIRNILLKEYFQSTQNAAAVTPTNADVDLAVNGLILGVFVPFDCNIEAAVDMSVGATSDFEFRPEIRVDGTVYIKQTPAAALGSAGGRGMTRGFTYTIPLTAGYHTISAGLELAAGAGYNFPTGSGFLTAAVPLEVMA